MASVCFRLLLVLAVPSMVHWEDKVNCQKFKFVIDEDVVYDHVLEGHVFKRSTVASASKCHVMCKDDCPCVSLNYILTAKENNCELNDGNKGMEPAALKSKREVNYYDLVRNYTVKVREDCWQTSPHVHCTEKCLYLAQKKTYVALK